MKLSVLKRKSTILLITGIVIILLLLPVWYIVLTPSIIASEIEKTDMITSYEGTLYYSDYGLGKPSFPVFVNAHVYSEGAKGDNVILNIEAKMMNMTDADDPNILNEFSYNLTYVINKFRLTNVPDAPEADKKRTGYDPLYPQHLRIDEDIPNVWLDNLNITATLEYRGRIEEEGLELYRYFVNETVTKEIKLPFGLRNVTLISSKTLLVEPLSGILAYTEKETLIAWMGWKQEKYYLKLVDLEYESTAKAKAEGIAFAQTSFDGIQLLELYLPTIFGVATIIMVIGLAFNKRRLERKISEAKAKPLSSRR
jgi:hypothetical protein